MSGSRYGEGGEVYLYRLFRDSNVSSSRGSSSSGGRCGRLISRLGCYLCSSVGFVWRGDRYRVVSFSGGVDAAGRYRPSGSVNRRELAP